MNSTNDVAASRLEIDRITKRYGTHTALDDVSLTAEAGEFVVLLGPSGSGKSTLLRVVAGIERVDAGRVRLGERLVADQRSHVPPEQRGLAMVFQDYALWPHLTVGDNVAYPLRRKRIRRRALPSGGGIQPGRRALPSGGGIQPDRRELSDRVGEALERVGLAAYAKRYPSELSGGEQQRVALARALVGRPGLLLFDEPLSNLDADLRERMRVEISTLARESGATAIYITHDQAEAFALADVIGVLDRGRLVQVDRPETIYRHPATPFVARFTGLAGELAGTVARIDGEFVVMEVCDHQRLRARTVGRLAVGDSARLLVRPAATRILPTGSAVGDGVLFGTVVDVAYRGRGYDHVVAAEEGTLTSVFDEQARARGSQVQVALDPQGCIAHRPTAE